MTTAATQLQFAAQFTMFLVAVAGLTLSLRPRLLGYDRPARALLALGFGTLTLGAFLQGSLLIERSEDAGHLFVLRMAGATLVALGSSRWAASRTGRILLLAGLAGVLVSGVVGGRGSGATANMILGVGAIAIGAALVAAGRQSIPVRIGTSAAGLLLLVVLVVSLAVSVVLTRNVEREALGRYGARVDAEAAAAASSARDSLGAGRLVAGSLAGSRTVDLLAVATSAPSSPAADLERARARTRLDEALSALAADEVLGLVGPVLVVDPSQVAQAAFPASTDNVTRLALAGNEVVVEAADAQGSRQSVAVVGDRSYAIAAIPVFVSRPSSVRQFVGTVVVAERLGRSYLGQRATGGEPISLALVTATSVLASSGPQPSKTRLLDAGRRVVEREERPSGIVDDRFLLARPVVGGTGIPDMALVASVPTAAVAETREALFRTLFLLALVVALVAVTSAVVVGERIGGGVRRLTAAAERIRGGELDTVVSVGGRDELGRLGATFDSMAGSIRTMTSDLRRAAEEEARLRTRLQTVVGGMGEALVAGNGDGTVTDCNPAAERLLGRRAPGCIGRPMGDVVTFTLTDRNEPSSLTPPLEGVATVVGSIVGADRTQVPVAVSVAALPDPDGGRPGSVLVLRDLRDERAVERMKREFLANIGHELRSPLTPIKGYASVLQRRAVEPAQAAAFAGEISAGVDQLERVITRLVNFATVSAGRLDLEVEAVPVQALVDDAVTRWRDRLGDHHPLVGRTGAGLSPLRIDRAHVDQAIDELVDNAVKYSPAGGHITIGADLANGSGDGGRRELRLSVTDEGVGLDPDRLAGLVAEFAQGDGSATRPFGGLGLGLALADRIVRAHRGSLTCELVDGRGTRFSILLPVDADDSAPRAPA